MFLSKNIYLIFDIVVVLLLLLVGVTAGVSHIRSRLTIYFALFSLAVGVWIITNYYSNDTTLSLQQALVANRLVFAMPIVALLMLIYFVAEVTRTRMSSRTATVYGLIAGGAVTLGMSPLVVGGIDMQSGVFAIRFGSFAAVYFAVIVVFVAVIEWLLRQAVRAQKNRNTRQAKQVIVLERTIISGLTLTLLTNFVAPAIFGQFFWTQFATVGILVLVGALLYAIVRHGLFDIRLTAVRSVAYLLSISTMAGIYFGLAYLASVTIFQDNVTTGLSMGPINIVMALILAFIFQPIKRFFDHWTNRIFYRDRYDTSEFITQLGRVLTSTTRLHEVLELAGEKIQKTLKSNGYMFLVYRDHHSDALVGQGIRNHFNDEEYASLRDAAAYATGHVILTGAMEHAKTESERHIHALLARRSIALVLPLASADEVIGYLLLGEQQGGGYGKRDISVLETIADELVIAIQNARSVQVVRDVNTHLEQRINDATRELRHSNARLLELDVTKDEFLSMASHQLRTPLTSIKGYISMVLEGDAGEITDTQRNLLSEAFASSERMVHLISDFLNVSRLQTGKFIIDRSQTDLDKITIQEVAGMQQMAENHGLKLSYKGSNRIPLLYVDEGKLRQVIMNFIDNAIYYSPEGKQITVDLAVEDGDVVLRVVDKGMGVPPEVQKKLFTKFFRAENARKQRPDGTGVGLFLAKKVIDGHGGRLVFESALGKGSTFGFRLPIKKLSVAPPPELSES